MPCPRAPQPPSIPQRARRTCQSNPNTPADQWARPGAWARSAVVAAPALGLVGARPPFFSRANAARTASVCGWPLAARNKKTPASRSCRGFPLHHGRSREARAYIRSFCVNFLITVATQRPAICIHRKALKKVLTIPRLLYLSTSSKGRRTALPDTVHQARPACNLTYVHGVLIHVVGTPDLLSRWIELPSRAQARSVLM